jgi:uncharacterized alpha-E superfamily protein
MLGQMSSQLNYARASDIVANGLHQFVDDFQTRLNSVGLAVSETFFQVVTPPQRMSQRQSMSRM